MKYLGVQKILLNKPEIMEDVALAKTKITEAMVFKVERETLREQWFNNKFNFDLYAVRIDEFNETFHTYKRANNGRYSVLNEVPYFILHTLHEIMEKHLKKFTNG